MNHTFHHTDQELISRILHGDQALFREVIARTEALVAYIVSGFVQGKEDREDLMQDIYLKAYHRLGSFRYEAKLSTWIASIAYNTCVNHLRKKRIPLKAPAENDSEYAPASAEDPLIILSGKQMSGILQQAIDALAPLNRTLIILYHQASCTIAEISHITGLPEGTIKSYLYRARRELQQQLLTTYKNKEAL